MKPRLRISSGVFILYQKEYIMNHYTEDQILKRTLQFLKEQGKTPGSDGPTELDLITGHALLIEEGEPSKQNKVANFKRHIGKELAEYGATSPQHSSQVENSLSDAFKNMNSHFVRGGVYDPDKIPDWTSDIAERLDQPEDHFGRRSDLYADIDADPRLNKYTDFFGAASMTTNDMSYNAGKSGNIAMIGTMGPLDMYNHGKEYNQHMENISSNLEAENRRYYEDITGGVHVPGVTDAKNREVANNYMVNMEQSLVQDYLDNMQKEEHDNFVRLNNDIVHSLGAWGGDFAAKIKGTIFDDKSYLNDFHDTFEKQNGRPFDFGRQADRVALGIFVTNEKLSDRY